MNRTLTLGFMALVIASYGFMASPNAAEAACSWNGYMNSGGKCGVSWEKKEHKKDKFTGGHYYNEDFLRAYIDRLLALLEMLEDRDGGSNNNDESEVRTLSATSIDEDSASLRAIVDMNDDDEAELFFEYGTSAGNLNKDSESRDLDSSDDGDTQSIVIDDLEEDTKYFFRAVVIQDDGNKDYGATFSFFTEEDDSNDDDVHPTVTTQSPNNVGTSSATLRGTVDMNDFENGVAFFVYGEDESQVKDVEDDFDSYDDVDEDGDDLRKSLVDPDVDDVETYASDVTQLDENTEIFYVMCVAYEDEDDDDTVACGTVREFETD
jgi:hypothetical protein